MDDEEDICSLLKDLFAGWGHDVSTALEGETALRLMELEKPNVVFLDRRMPGMKGLDIMKKMSEKGIQAHVIVTTADVDEKVHDEFRSLGAVGVLTKPFEILKMKDQLADMLPLVFKDQE
ncbi:response regulator [Candidatus Uhrbacteria bacterium]|nr:response regulator [Candidatus Uhrbacteria bacterium]